MKTLIEVVENKVFGTIALLINGNHVAGPEPLQHPYQTNIGRWKISEKKLRRALGHRFGRRVRYRFIENTKRQPVITECTIQEPNGDMGIGYAICSRSEPMGFNGKEGKKWAYSRARIALQARADNLEITRGRAIKRITECSEPMPSMKSIFIPGKET